MAVEPGSDEIMILDQISMFPHHFVRVASFCIGWKLWKLLHKLYTFNFKNYSLQRAVTFVNHFQCARDHITRAKNEQK